MWPLKARTWTSISTKRLVYYILFIYSFIYLFIVIIIIVIVSWTLIDQMNPYGRAIRALCAYGLKLQSSTKSENTFFEKLFAYYYYLFIYILFFKRHSGEKINYDL